MADNNKEYRKAVREEDFGKAKELIAQGADPKQFIDEPPFKPYVFVFSLTFLPAPPSSLSSHLLTLSSSHLLTSFFLSAWIILYSSSISSSN